MRSCAFGLAKFLAVVLTAAVARAQVSGPTPLFVAPVAPASSGYVAWQNEQLPTVGPLMGPDGQTAAPVPPQRSSQTTADSYQQTQQAQQTDSQARATTPADSVPFAERNFSEDLLAMPLEHLFGSWCGYRTEWEDNGIKPGLVFVSDLMGNPSGGLRQGFTEADNLGFDVTFDLEKRHGIEGGSFFYSMSQRSGNSLSKEYIGNTFDTQQVFGGPTFHVVDIAYQQKFGDDAYFRIGPLGASDDFLVSPYNFRFVQNGFCGAPNGIFINAPGMSGYPNATWGTILKVRPTDRTYVMGGLYNGDTTIRDLNNHGLDLSFDGPPFSIVEFAYQRNQLKDDKGLPGNYKFGAWFDGNDFADQESLGAGLAAPLHAGNFGFYGLFDQVLMRFGSEDEEILRGIGVVSSVVISPDQSLSVMPYFFNVGLAVRGMSPQRPRDAMGVGIVFGEFSDELRQGQRLAQQSDPTVGVQKHEIALEWTYIFRFRKGAYFFQPDLQYIIRPGGTGQIPNAFVVGSQVGVNF